MKTILVTGDDGYIGKWIVKELSKNYDIVGLSRHSGGENYNRKKFDLTDKTFPKIDFDGVVHLASMTGIRSCENNPKLANESNVNGTRRLLEMSKENEIERFVYVSTGSVYGYSDRVLDESMKVNPKNTYAKTKYLAEESCREYSSYFPVNVMRLFFPYGPDTHPERMVANIMKKVCNEDLITLNRDSKPRTNPVYIKDLVNITKSLLNQGEGYEVYNIAGNEVVDIKELSQLIGKVVGKKPVFEQTENESKNFVADISKLKKLLGKAPETSLEQGLEETYGWLKTKKKL